MINLQKQFLALLPARPLLVGEVLSISDGVAVVQLPGGGVLHTRGAATVGQRVFIRDGAIEGPAPVLDYVAAEI